MMTALDNILSQVSTMPLEDKQTLRYYINQSLRRQNVEAFKKEEAMRQIRNALIHEMTF